ncbi:beta-glucosidase [candidate division KSB3 bacterium]|uniref:Beta-glucosidase n=1 Tax=candidate division KSB3 bacterium TaxID=2044937 RepID=A0A2G6KIG5_9BACT|nr:MAG: beta-glucosidase [candidate division KSB3 bacterium]
MFGSDFLWGVATSSYQIEGAVTAGGRGESIWDRFSHTLGKIVDGSNGDTACEHYRLHKEDIRLMTEIGVNAYRFSIAWPRILPKGFGAVNQTGLDFYSRLVDELLGAGITPTATLYHWDLPQALQDRGGWGTRDTAKAFAEYAYTVAKALGDRVDLWITHNEMWCTTFLGHYHGIFAPGKTDFGLALQAAHHILLSHGLAVPIMKNEIRNDAQIGIAPNIAYPYPASDSQSDLDAAHRYDGFFNRWFLDPLAGRGYPEDMWEYYQDYTPRMEDDDLTTIAAPIDFLGINYYNADQIANDPHGDPPYTKVIPDSSRKRTADREIYAPGLYESLIRIHQDYDFPAIYITENGAAYPDEIADDGQVHDTERIGFLDAHFEQAALAIEASVPLKGYFVWSLMDNFEWSQGYTLRYGLTYVDFKTQERVLKDSAKWYKQFIEKSKG